MRPGIGRSRFRPTFLRRQSAQQVAEQSIGVTTHAAAQLHDAGPNGAGRCVHPPCAQRRGQSNVDVKRPRAQRLLEPGAHGTKGFAHNALDECSIHCAARVALADRDAKANAREGA